MIIMEKYEIYEIKALSFEGRLRLQHEFEMAGKSEEEVRQSITTRWPELYDIEITKSIKKEKRYVLRKGRGVLY